MMTPASALSDGSVGLSWDIADKKQTYRIYSDMGAGYGLHIYKEDTNEAAFIDNAAQPGRLYSYKVSALEKGKSSLWVWLLPLRINLPPLPKQRSFPAHRAAL